MTSFHASSPSRSGAAAALALLAVLSLAGCASSHLGDTIDLEQNGLQGDWQYLVTNAYEATFVGCGGDAAVLEGKTFAQAQSLVPMCLPAGSFGVAHSGGDFSVPAYAVTCSDGSTGSAGGAGEVVASSVGGQWESISQAGVSAQQTFTGVVQGETIHLSETRRAFSGALSGACDLVPPLVAEIHVGP